MHVNAALCHTMKAYGDQELSSTKNEKKERKKKNGRMVLKTGIRSHMDHFCGTFIFF